MNSWQKVVEFFNANQKCTRVMFLSHLGVDKTCGYNTLDTYRNNLRSAGFLKTVDLGMYKRIKKIPDNLTINKCLSIISDNKKIIIEEEKIKIKAKLDAIQYRLDAII